jgi:electron transport complex protein RnfG
MKATLKLILTLTVICAVAGVLLAMTYAVTLKPVREARTAERLAALSTVLPEYDNNPDTAVCDVEQDGIPWRFHVARNHGVYAGTAFETRSVKGYGGDIVLMVGVDADGKVHGIEILEQKETPGLGAKIKDDAFKQGFAGRPVKRTAWRVRKDQGDIDQITAATISSRAVVEAVGSGLAVYAAHEDAIRATR